MYIPGFGAAILNVQGVAKGVAMAFLPMVESAIVMVRSKLQNNQDPEESMEDVISSLLSMLETVFWTSSESDCEK